ncbi:MAG: PKD domain-containing protein [Flavisolibacter sp.]|nr:PKD domain-containing protein [Flavisolibacter sp.]
MKKSYPLLFLVVFLFTQFQIKANEVTIKGYVRLASGSGVENIPVKILVDEPCPVEHSALSNTSGFYSDKVSCTADIRKVRIRVKNCDGKIIEVIKEVPSSNVIEANFTVCSSSLSCVAKFTFESVSSTGTQTFPVKFNSSGSETSNDDKIVERSWTFGDGSNGSTVDPTHNFEKPGTYNVCLTVKSAKGCSNTRCQTVEVKASCKANFTFEQTQNGVRFNSNISTAATNDAITIRRWNFGDGTPVLEGNVDPLHVFAHTGTYTVCLTTLTKNRCESKECKQVVVTQTPTAAACTARFSFEQIGPKKFRFNSSSSTVGAEDKIVGRQWIFRDGSPVVSNNEISQVHEFEKPGTYEVCLIIKTTKGCESKFCLAIKVDEGAFNTDNATVKIVSLYPAPVHNELKAVIYSKYNNVTAIISIIDVYGQTKWSKEVMLVQGNSPFVIATGNLLPGPYFFRVTSQYGTQTKSIFKQ